MKIFRWFWIILLSLIMMIGSLPVWAKSLLTPQAVETVLVHHVIDGDTIVLEDGRHVRYIGINSPEITTPKKKGEGFGKEAQEFNRSLVNGKKVRLVFDEETTDQYNRVLAYVYLEDGTFINGRMVEQGYAYCLYDKKNNREAEGLLELQRKAMTGRKGIWQDEDYQKKEELLGNIKSRRFHQPHCAVADRISPKNRKWFDSRWKAFWEGYSPSKKCGAD
jgi:micrococcal nuclease